MVANASKGVTRVYSRKIMPSYEKQYDDWLRRYLAYVRQIPGHLGTTVIVPGGTNSNLRYIIHHFSDNKSLDEAERSEQAIKMLDEVNNYSTRKYETATGLETWFTVPDIIPAAAIVAPPKWKMAIIVFAAAYAISSLSRYSLNPFLGQWSLLASGLIYTEMLVILLTYVAMPSLSKLLRNWLYPNNKISGFVDKASDNPTS